MDFRPLFIVLLLAMASTGNCFEYRIDPERAEFEAIPTDASDSLEMLADFWTGDPANAEIVRTFYEERGEYHPMRRSSISVNPLVSPFLFRAIELDPESRDSSRRLFDSPNCFASVILYHNPDMEHRFYNSDELLAYLQENFRSIPGFDVRASRTDGLRREESARILLPGDVIVFSRTWGGQPNRDPDVLYSSQRRRRMTVHENSPIHATTYLVSGYVFNKRGPGASHSYQIISLEEMLRDLAFSEVRFYRPNWRR